MLLVGLPVLIDLRLLAVSAAVLLVLLPVARVTWLALSWIAGAAAVGALVVVR